MTGGYSTPDRLSSTDIIDQDFNIKRGPDLPDTIYNHCVTNWNSSHMLLTGGYTGSKRYSFSYEDKNKLLISTLIIATRFITLMLKQRHGHRVHQ